MAVYGLKFGIIATFIAGIAFTQAAPVHHLIAERQLDAADILEGAQGLIEGAVNAIGGALNDVLGIFGPLLPARTCIFYFHAAYNLEFWKAKGEVA